MQVKRAFKAGSVMRHDFVHLADRVVVLRYDSFRT